MSLDAWTDLAAQLGGVLPKFNDLLSKDGQYQAFTATKALEKDVTFAIKAVGSDNAILITANRAMGTAKAASSSQDALFTLSALPEQWKEFFKPQPVAPYQSYWGMVGMNIKHEGVRVLGDEQAFAVYTHIWRRALELLHEAYCGPLQIADEPQPEEDHIVGRYVYVIAPLWGRCKVFYEQSGTGKQDIVFLHTAGSDSRQYHGVMNYPRMRERCNMIAFDLPGHGRSFPSRSYLPGQHTNTEDSYVGCIAAVVKALNLNKPIICGASMAGQVCLAVAIRADEVGAGGSIPLQG